MTRFLFRISSQGMELVDALIKSMPRHCQWKGGTWSELNRTKVYSIVKKLSSAKVGNPLYLNSSHVIRAKPLHSSLHQKRSPSLKKNSLLVPVSFCIPQRSHHQCPPLLPTSRLSQGILSNAPGILSC